MGQDSLKALPAGASCQNYFVFVILERILFIMNQLPVAIVGKHFSDKRVFFNILKDVCEIKKVRAVHQVPKGLEVTFFDVEALKVFLAGAPEDLKVTSEANGVREVTVTPKIGTGHVLVPDSAMWSCMERFGVVEEGKRPIWGGVGDFELETGARVFKVRPDLDAQIPSSLVFGRAAFGVTYAGQKLRCHACQSPNHGVKQCREKVCFKCRGVGHYIKECKNGYRCTVCDELGHTYDRCPKSKSVRVVLGREWTNKDGPVTPMISGEEVFEGAPNAPLKPTTQSEEKSGSSDQALESTHEGEEANVETAGIAKPAHESTHNGEGENEERGGAAGVVMEGDLTQLTPILQQKRLPKNRRDSFGSDREEESLPNFSQVTVSGLKPGIEGYQTNQVYQWKGKESFAEMVEQGFPEAPWNTNRGGKRSASPSLSDKSVKVKNDKV